MHSTHGSSPTAPGPAVSPGALETFLAVHRAGTITGASDHLHLSQPAVSRRLQALERTFAVPLFDRIDGRLRINAAGLVLLPYAERVVAAQIDALGAVADHRDGASGYVQIGIVGSLVQTWFTDVLRTTLRRHPDVDLAVTTASSRHIHDAVVSGELTVGISYARPRDAVLVARTLFVERLVVVCAPDADVAGRRVTVDGLAAQRWLLFPDRPAHPESANSVARRALERHQVPAENLRPIDSLTAQAALARAGYGLALLPESAVADDLAAARLGAVDVADLEAAAPVVMLTRQGTYLGPAARTVIDAISGRDPPVGSA